MTRDTTQKTVGTCFAIVAATAGILYWMGRSWWCSCGSPIPWSWDIWSSHNSQHLIDPYFFSHVLHGILFYATLTLLPKSVSLQARLVIAITIEACWEILENSPLIIDRYRAVTISLDYYGDSISNSMFDIFACVLGFWIAASLRWRWTVAILVATELVLLVTIRDNLTLNIIMLVWPIDAIKEWQSP